MSANISISDKTTIEDDRNYKIVKSNELIQKSRYNLTLQEQKIILYIISKIRPEDAELETYDFEISDFCRICGVDERSGANYKYIKQTLKTLRDKSILFALDEDTETTLSWIEKVTFKRKSGLVKIKLDDDMKPFLVQLKEKFTSFELLYVLTMRSQYSIRLYELLKSYQYRRIYTFDIENLKRRVNAENYSRFPDFKRFVLEKAVSEINELSDIFVSYELKKDGRRYAEIRFSIKLKKNLDDRLKTWQQIKKRLDKSD